MFIGQGISIEDRRAAQAERRAANNVMAAASTAAALVAAERSADVATVTAAAPRLPPPRRTAQLDDQVPKKFPGEKGIMRPNMVPFLLVIFSLMDTIRPHVEVGHRNSRATSKWKELYQRFFDRTDGVGRQFELWGGDDGWKKFKKAVMCAVFGYSKAYGENDEGAPSDVMMKAHLLEVSDARLCVNL